MTIDSSGGAVDAPDGRVMISFPTGATTQPLDIRITRADHRIDIGPSPDYAFIAEWSFDAYASNQGMAPVHTFDANPTITLHFSQDDLVGRNPRGLHIWTIDPSSGKWVSLPANVDLNQLTVTAQVSHFTLFGASASTIVDMAPLLDSHNVDLHTGSASLKIPIQVPPGRGGLTPELTLTYDSARVDEMRLYSSLSGWTGIGWELTTGSIQASYDATNGDRYFLNMAGFGGELMQDGSGAWRLRDEQYVRVVQTTNGWTVTDKQGRQYVFGGDDAHRRWYLGYGTRKYYRWDVSSVQDVLGNTISYSYWQQTCDQPYGVPANCGSCSASCYVLAAYPTDIKYNGASGQELTDIHFNLDGLGNPPNDMVDNRGQLPNIIARKDDPYLVTDNRCAPETSQYVPPLVQEIRNLGSIDVQNTDPGNGPQLVRRYKMTYNTTNFASSVTWQTPSCPPLAFTGVNELTSLSVLDRTATNTLSTMNFQYNWPDQTPPPSTLPTFAYLHEDGTVFFGYQWPYMTQATNGFGGQVQFTYAMQNSSSYNGQLHWERSAVIQEVDNAWNGQTNPAPPEPSITRTYAYLGYGPYELDYPYPAHPSTYDPFGSASRGYAQVTETDAANNQAVHSYFTTGGTVAGNCLNGNGTPQNPEICTGREYATLAQDAVGNPWKKTTTTYTVRAISGTTINFVYPSQTDTYLKNGSTLGTDMRVQNTYDNGLSDTACGQPPPSPQCFGLLTKVDDLGDAADGTHGAEVITNTTYNNNATAWLFVPRTVQKLDPASNLLQAANLYYDGSAALSPASPPAKGLLTAKSAQVNVARYAVSYSAYDSYGNVVAASVPTFTTPENVPTSLQSQPPGAATGWLPSGLASTTTTYDPTYHVFPTAQTNSLNQTVTTGYDYVLGKPTGVTQPNDDVLHTLYDGFGRVWRIWDNLDSQQYPTRQYTYSWGTAPNQTTTYEKKTAGSGSSTLRLSVSCTDGFGRAVEQRQHYLVDGSGAHMNSVRTDYDARGMKAAVANAVDGGTGADCPAIPTSLGAVPTSCPAATGLNGRDRTTYLYDPPGNITCTASLSGDGTQTAAQMAQYNGLTTMSCDADGHTTAQVRTIASRQTTVYAPTLSIGACFDPNFAQHYTSTVSTYDRLGHLTQVQDAQNNVTTLTYDLAGRKSAMQDPDMGHWAYTYDAAGNLHTQTDAKGQTTTLLYDALNRLTRKSYTSGQPELTYRYDCYTAPPCAQTGTAIGHLTQTGRGAGVPYTLLFYDVRGQLTTASTVVNGQVYITGTGYDDLGQVTSITYPDGEIVSYGEDTVGDINALTSNTLGALVNSAVREPWGAPASVGLGSGQTTTYAYDYKARMKSITTGTAQNLTLSYDAASNVTEAKDTTTISPEDMIYDYDQLNRLKDMHPNGSSTNTAAYTYGALGDTLTKQEDTNLTLCYPAVGSPRPHAVTSVYNTSGAQCTYPSPWLALSYDANGNLRQQTQGSTTTSYTFDSENRLKTRTVAGGVERYAYDAGGTLINRTNPDGTSTVYIGGMFEKSFDSSGTATCVRRYYQFGGRSIAVNEVHLSGTGCASGLSYLLDDHLGSTSTVTDNLGTVQATQKYWPYGSLRAITGQNTISQTDKLFTSQQQETGDALGLYDYKARFYSTTTGRFVSGDTVAKDGLNRFGYVRDNPLRYIDPSGLDAAIFCGTTDDCESGTAGNMRQWVEQYWAQHEHIFLGDSPLAGVSMADYAFALLEVVLNQGWKQVETLSAFHVAFWNSSSDFPSYLKREQFSGVSDIEQKFWNTTQVAPRPIDTLIGFSLGGYVAAAILADSASHGYSFQTAILIQPAFHVSAGPFDLGMGTPLTAADVPNTRIITFNGSDSPVGGRVIGAIDITTSGCGHCSMEDWAYWGIWAGMRSVGSLGDYLIESALGPDINPYFPPIPVPLPLPVE